MNDVKEHQMPQRVRVTRQRSRVQDGRWTGMCSRGGGRYRIASLRDFAISGGRLHSLDYESLSFTFGSGKPEKCLEVERSCVGSSSYWQPTPPPPPPQQAHSLRGARRGPQVGSCISPGAREVQRGPSGQEASICWAAPVPGASTFPGTQQGRTPNEGNQNQLVLKDSQLFPDLSLGGNHYFV